MPLVELGEATAGVSRPVFPASPLEASDVSGTVLGVTGGRPVFWLLTPIHQPDERNRL